MLRIHYLLTYCYPITSHSFIIAFFSTLQREIVLFVTLGVSADMDLSAALYSEPREENTEITLLEGE